MHHSVPRWARVFCAGLLLAFWAGAPAAGETARAVFGAASGPAAMAPAAHGSYSKGCLAGAVQLAETGATWQAMRLSRNRAWGHPALIRFVERLGASAQSVGWTRIYVGDLSQPRGGPMLSGHRSHQIGLDADIWLRRPLDRLLSTAERETISSHRVVTGLTVNEMWSREHASILRAAAEDEAVARIFVNSAIKQRLCETIPEDDRAWLRKIRPWYGHDAHFHVRLACPDGSSGCADQAPIPPGDGCDATLAWWFSDEARNPKPSPGPRPRPRPAMTLADLPAACVGVARR